MTPRVLQVSALMDSTNPDLAAFHARGGKLIMLENMADYAQSPYAGIALRRHVRASAGPGAQANEFLRLYIAPGVDHVGTGAPGNVDMLAALVDWVERGSAPAGAAAGRAGDEAAVRGHARAAAVRMAAGRATRAAT